MDSSSEQWASVGELDADGIQAYQLQAKHERHGQHQATVGHGLRKEQKTASRCHTTRQVWWAWWFDPVHRRARGREGETVQFGRCVLAHHTED